ncbi:MAG: hypothetical protein JWQ87_3846 [Candidatus Sulfotelmatobacter sp.]|nr:hypothetical protein [Candidatus Sulfotelmatobacter sp.]
MRSATTNRLLAIALCVGTASTFVALGYAAPYVQQSPPTSGANRRIGTVKEISGTEITLVPDSGSDVILTIEETTRVVRVVPGEKDLKNAVPIRLQDIQIGDRILAGGKAADDNRSFAASSIVVMKQADLAARHEQDLQDWQKRGVDGLAKVVDAAAETVTISVRGKDVLIHTSKSTAIRRYAPDSVKFDDAKSSTLQEVRPGDQVRARGDRSADGGELTAEEVVSGSFPLLAGTINSIDANSSTLSIHDLSSNKNVVVRITQDSQLRNLPPEMAQRIAMRLKGAGGAAAAASAAHDPSAGNSQMKREKTADPSPAAPEGGMASRGNGTGGRSSGGPDLQQILGHAPNVSLADLHKGDAVVVLATQGNAGSGTALKLFSGVEPILRAAPNAAQAMMLAPWNLSGPSGDVGGP